MDNLTHSLVGAALSKAGAERTTPLATATLVVAANAPDVDIFSYVHGPYFALSFRRGITHGLPAMAVLTLVVAGLMLAWDRWIRLRRSPDAPPARPGAILALSALGLLTHPTLDWMNTYGMRWMMPIDGAWTYGDALFIIDPWLWLLLGGAVFLSRPWGRTATAAWAVLAALTTALMVLAPLPLSLWVRVGWVAGMGAMVWKGRRVAADAAAPVDAAATAPMPRILLGAACAYIVLMVVSDLAARRFVAGTARAAGLEVYDLMVQPLPGTPGTNEVEVLTDRGFVPGRHRWLPTPRVELQPEMAVPLLTRPVGLTPADAERILARAREVPDAHYWLEWSRYPYARIEAGEDGWRVSWRDARYDRMDGSGELSGVTVTVP